MNQFKITSRKGIAILLLIFASMVYMSCTNNDHNIVGTWKANSSDGQTVSMVFDATGNAVWAMGSKVIGGKDYQIDGQKYDVKYETNYSMKPYWLDIVLYPAGSNKESSRTNCILRFLNDDKIEIRASDAGKPRFDKFDSDDSEHTIIFERVIKK